MTTAKFASVADLEVKKTTFQQLSAHCWAYTAEGDPNTGVIIGEDSVLICDALATPVMAQSLIAEIRKVSDKPIKYVVLSHYHAVRVLGASGYKDAGMQEIIASQGTYEMIVERGAQDMQSEYERFPRLFNNFDSIPGLTWPTLVFKDAMTLWMGKLEVKIMHVGPGHTKGDTIVWVPSEQVLFSGDLVEADAACYTGDAQLEEWPATLEALRALKAEAIGLAVSLELPLVVVNVQRGGPSTGLPTKTEQADLPWRPWAHKNWCLAVARRCCRQSASLKAWPIPVTL